MEIAAIGGLYLAAMVMAFVVVCIAKGNVLGNFRSFARVGFLLIVILAAVLAIMVAIRAVINAGHAQRSSAAAPLASNATVC
jgi:hypothetical protein